MRRHVTLFPPILVWILTSLVARPVLAAWPDGACTAHQLEAQFVDRQGGPAEVLLVLRNLGAQACQMNVLPPLTFYGGDGEQRLVGAQYPDHPSVAWVTLAPGEAVAAPLAWEERDIEHAHNCITPLMAALNLPGGALRLLFGRQMCATGGSLVELTQWPLTSWPAQGTSETP